MFTALLLELGSQLPLQAQLLDESARWSRYDTALDR